DLVAGTVTQATQLTRARRVRRVRRGGRYAARRLASVLATLLATSFLVFSSLYIAPGNPIDFLVRGRSPSPEAIAAVEAQYGLDKRFFTQYLDWLGAVLHGDLGRSFQFRENVSTLIVA